MAIPAAAVRFPCVPLQESSIKFAGVGEKLDDLEVFHPSRMASRILGMGDVLTLIEKRRTPPTRKRPKKPPSA